MSRACLPAAGIAAVALAAFAASLLLNPGAEHGLSYLASFGFAFSTLLGGLILLLIGYAVSARWLLVFRRVLEGVALALPLLVPLLVPLVIARWDVGPRTGSLAMRSAVSFAVWLCVAELLRRGSLARERNEVSWAERSRVTLSAVGIPLVGLTGSLAACDWLSATPGWNMTGMALYLLTGGYTAALGAVAVCFWWLRRTGQFPELVASEHSHALGRMLLSGVCLWAYLGASQLIIVWSANLPREAVFYLPRAAQPWRVVVWLLVFGHFLVPFLLLLLREPKRRPSFVAVIGGWLVLMHAFDCYWLLVPSPGRGPRASDALPFALITVALVAFGSLRFSLASPLPKNEPEFERSLHYEAP